MTARAPAPPGSPPSDRVGTRPPVLDPLAIRADFPILAPRPGFPALAYLDNAATTQKPRSVIARMVRYYEEENANVHRGVHRLAEAATEAFEGARQRVARYAGMASTSSVVFTRNATEALNLVARAWGGSHIGAGDEVLVTAMEHHSNLVPWQRIAAERGARLRVVPVDDDGRLDREAWRRMLGRRTRVVAFTAKSNVLGTENPVAAMAAEARGVGARVVVDGAQQAPVGPFSFAATGADFLAFSGHKMLGPMGSGVLLLGDEAREELPPFLYGGEMVRRVTEESATWNDPPWRWEAGTPSVADAVGLGAAMEYLEALGREAVRAHEVALTARALEGLSTIAGIRLFGPRRAEDRPGVVSFWLPDVHPHDLAQLLDAEGIAVRAGNHCAQPLLARSGVVATTRASFYVYNTLAEVDRLVEGVQRARRRFAGAGR